MDFTLAGPLKIGGFTVAVEEATHDLTYRGLVGYCDNHRMVIQLRTDLGDQAIAQTYVHEVMHMLEEVYLEGDTLTERQISALSHGLFQILVDNPNFVQAACASKSSDTPAS